MMLAPPRFSLRHRSLNGTYVKGVYKLCCIVCVCVCVLVGFVCGVGWVMCVCVCCVVCCGWCVCERERDTHTHTTHKNTLTTFPLPPSRPTHGAGGCCPQPRGVARPWGLPSAGRRRAFVFKLRCVCVFEREGESMCVCQSMCMKVCGD